MQAPRVHLQSTTAPLGRKKQVLHTQLQEKDAPKQLMHGLSAHSLPTFHALAALPGPGMSVLYEAKFPKEKKQLCYSIFLET
jgi:hypothetical protein